MTSFHFPKDAASGGVSPIKSAFDPAVAVRFASPCFGSVNDVLSRLSVWRARFCSRWWAFCFFASSVRDGVHEPDGAPRHAAELRLRRRQPRREALVARAAKGRRCRFAGPETHMRRKLQTQQVFILELRNPCPGPASAKPQPQEAQPRLLRWSKHISPPGWPPYAGLNHGTSLPRDKNGFDNRIALSFRIHFSHCAMRTQVRALKLKRVLY